MKTKLSILLTVFLLLAAPLGAQDGSKGTISSTPHDLSSTAGSLCGVCHIAHQDSGTNRTLLWNHATTTATAYSVYGSSTFNASSTIAALDQSSTAQQTGDEFYSLSCMSCHDGATATNTVYRAPDGLSGTANGSFFDIGTGAVITGASNVGTALNNDHPVNFTYNAALATADGGLFNPVGGTPWGTVRASSKGANGEEQEPVLFNDTVQCATCHNPHNNANGTFLRQDNGSSALCLRCHSTT